MGGSDKFALVGHDSIQ